MHYIFKLDPKKPPSPPPERSSIDLREDLSEKNTDAIEAAIIIRNYCAGRTCEKCCFGDVNNKYCVFTQRIIPSEWNLGFAAMKKDRTVIIMLSKYIQYFLDENDLAANEPFTIVIKDTNEKVYEETFYINANATDTTNILMRSDNKGVYISALVALLSGMCLPKKEPWQPEIGDVYFYVAVGDKGEGIIHAETLFDKNDIKFLLLKKAKKYYRTYLEAKKHLKTDYEDLKGE